MAKRIVNKAERNAERYDAKENKQTPKTQGVGRNTIRGLYRH